MTTYKTTLKRNLESSTDTDISNDNIILFDYPFDDKKRYIPKSNNKTQTNIRKFVKEKANNIIPFPYCPFDEKLLILKSNNKTQKVFNVRKLVEKKVDSVILTETYEELHELLNKYESETLDILYKKTQDREIDLGTPKGKQIWKKVIEFYRDNKEKLDLIYNFLAKYSRTKFQQHVYEFVYDIVASTWWAITFDPEIGQQTADNFVRFLLKKRTERLKRMLAG